MKKYSPINQNKKEAATILLFWSVMIGLSLSWNFQRERERVLQLAEVEAQASLKKDRAFRLWGTRVGGFYVEVKNDIQPSPFMKHVAERDVITPSGKKLTLYSPAITLRLIMAAQEELYGTKARITGEVYINPANAPDEWEKKGLKIVKQSHKDFSEVTEMDGKPVLRYMRPMIMSENCTKCHTWTGIKIGEMRGATDIAISLDPFLALEQDIRDDLIASHIGLWTLGVFFIRFFSYRKKRYLDELDQQNKVLQTEVDRRVETEKKLEELAYKDILTQLPNRQLFYDRLELELIRAKRKSDVKLALLFIDLDDFKRVNDTVGHHIGDELLVEVAQRIKTCVRDQDTVARLGGDEFTIIISDIKSSMTASDIAENIIHEISLPITLQGCKHFVGASIGISVYPEDSKNMDILVRDADAAMYHAKENGRGNYQFYSEKINDRNQKRRQLDEDLRKAVEEEEFELYYQPQIDTFNNKLIGAEALIRWNHPEGHLVSPFDFIPVAEENGLIIEIGEWVFKQACHHVHKCLSLGKKTVPVSINLSAVQFAHEGLVEMIETTLKHEKVSSDLIEIEITESAIMENTDKAIETIEQLNEMGIRISIDDFGTGYSSLAYLKKFSVNKLKIDREFIKDLPQDREDVVLTSTMIMLANKLELDVLAEGVETKEQVDFLLELGCNLVQGYYYSKPLPEDEFISYVLSMKE
ncbi:MAG: EAL domain-containing protein [Gammaproteobacteria bacterium]|nr:EAL domain-containing protein [Gammaproteobacteria bacterium]